MDGQEKAKSAQRRPQVLKGFRDYLPKQMILRRRIIETFREIFERHGFEPLDTPALEYLEVLTGKAGENEKLMYHFLDQGEREVGMRYDLTVPLARVVAMHQDELVMPFKRYHIAPVWRAEKPQRGRFREFWQCDADVAGSASMVADAEVVAIMAEALTAVGLPNFTIHISHRRLLESIALASGVPEAQAGTIYRAVDKLAKIGRQGVRRDLIDGGIEEEVADRVVEAVTAEGTAKELLDDLAVRLEAVQSAGEAIAELRQLFELLPPFGVPERAYRLDLSLARGLDYYTGPVYEATVDEPKVGSVAGAGRYDKLVGTFLGRPIPATGISLGLERIIEVVEEFGLLPTPATVADVVVTVFPDTLAASARIARELRNAGFNVDGLVQPNRSLGDQLKYANRKGVRFAVIAGSAELDRGEASLKDLASGEQTTVPLARVAEEMRIRSKSDGTSVR
ncbi:MAG: histidyl-tRNA synthetase [Thermomicrobiales bacterium]|nr:histidyl-tRNA synthetase [Thermomicrobiales bacterium]